MSVNSSIPTLSVYHKKSLPVIQGVRVIKNTLCCVNHILKQNTNIIMADANVEPSSNDGESNYSTPANDPKNMQEVTQYVQSLLQNMQDKFQSMSDQIINRIDEMGTRVDELEKNITDLMTQAGVENDK